jgi:small subunit ribosomal protein S18
MASKKQKNSPISLNQKIDYKDIDLLTLFVTEQGKILPRRATGVTVQQQRKLAKAIKRAEYYHYFLLLHRIRFKSTNYLELL